MRVWKWILSILFCSFPLWSQEPPRSMYAFNYFKFHCTLETNVGFSLGKRIVFDSFYGLDFSTDTLGGKDFLMFTCPKVVGYTYFADPSFRSLYIGGGASLGGIFSKRIDKAPKHSSLKYKNQFMGILGEGVLGVEFGQNHPIHRFIEIDATVGMIPFEHYGKKVAYVVSLCTGFGF